MGTENQIRLSITRRQSQKAKIEREIEVLQSKLSSLDEQIVKLEFAEKVVIEESEDENASGLWKQIILRALREAAEPLHIKDDLQAKLEASGIVKPLASLSSSLSRWAKQGAPIESTMLEDDDGKTLRGYWQLVEDDVDD